MKTIIFAIALLAVAFARPEIFKRPIIKIIGGENATRGEFPYQVSYQYKYQDTWQHICGGSIVSDKWILTAGHCVTDPPEDGQYRIVAGILNLDDTDRQVIEVVEKITHPDYPGGVATNDLALLRLKSPLKFNDNVKKIAISSTTNPTGDAIITGWGWIGEEANHTVPNTLQKSKLPLIPSKECKDILDKLLNHIEPFNITSMICTGPLTGGHGCCIGDNGTPLAKDGEIIGLVTWSIVPCGMVGAPSVYTEVSAFYDWIQSYIK